MNAFCAAIDHNWAYGLWREVRAETQLKSVQSGSVVVQGNKCGHAKGFSIVTAIFVQSDEVPGSPVCPLAVDDNLDIHIGARRVKDLLDNRQIFAA
jgi:hypothetical protein